MRILIDISHPSHVHLFKNTIWNLENKGHKVKITARGKENTLLLNAYGLEYEVVGKHRDNLVLKGLNMFDIDYMIYKVAKIFKPDICIGESNMYVAHASKLIKKPSIIFDDSERGIEHYLLFAPFATIICTPSGYRRKVNPKKHVKYNGYKELAYLHPNNYKPDSSILDSLNLCECDKFVILRFNAFTSSHDVGIRGFNMEMKYRLIKELEKHSEVFISSEVKLPARFEKYIIQVPQHKLHDILYYATLLVGDTQTMTTEAAVLGVPAIRCNTFVGPRDMSNFIELEQKYGLIFNFRDPQKAIEKAVELIQQPNLKKEWLQKRKNLLKDKIDVTAFMTWFIENYPESFKVMKENPDYQRRFK